MIDTAGIRRTPPPWRKWSAFLWNRSTFSMANLTDRLAEVYGDRTLFLLDRPLDTPYFQGDVVSYQDLNRLVRDRATLHELDHDWHGFAWIDFGDIENSVVSFVRWSGEREGLLFTFNLTPIVRSEYRIGVPRAGTYTEVLNTDAACYGGSGVGNLGSVKSDSEPRHGHDHSILVTLPPLAALAFELPAAPPEESEDEEE